MAPHSSIFAWKVPWTEEPGRLQYMGSQSRMRLSNYIYICMCVCVYVCLFSTMDFCGKESACQCRRPGFSPCMWKIPWERNGNPLQNSGLGNPMGRGAWWATVHGIGKELNMTQKPNKNKFLAIIYILMYYIFHDIYIQ